MQTVWEARFFNYHFFITIIISIIVMIVSVVLFIKKHNVHLVLIRVVCSILFILTVSFFLNSLYTAYYDWQYAKKNSFVVEGIVEDYSTGNNGSDSFLVDDVFFYCTPIDNNLFAYTLTKRDKNSVIDGDGQWVRITYCTQNGLNSILKIETKSRG
jgi:uncharacterized membrane protein YraQ (UPF0718 family)